MGQDTSGTSLTTTATATGRVPVCRFKVDWGDDGFGSQGQWTNESAYVISVRGDMQATDYAHSIAVVGKSVSDVVYVTCRNPDVLSGGSGLRFSQTNENGPLYEYIGDGKLHMKRATLEMGFKSGGTPEYLHQITGYIVDAPEHNAPDTRTITFQIRDKGAGCASTRAGTALYADTDAPTYMAALCALLERDPIATAYQDFDEGMVVVPYLWMDDETIWEEMAIMAEAHLGRVWFDKDGNLKFDDGTHFVKPHDDAWDDPTVIQATLRVTSFGDCAPTLDFDAVRNHIVVEYSPYYLGQEQQVYSASETLRILPGGTLTHKAETQYPVSSITEPVANTDYVAVTAGGTDMTSSITVAHTDYAAYSDLTLTNSDAEFTAFITKLNLRGIPLLSGQTAKYIAPDNDSIALYGKKTWTVRNPYIQSARHAKTVGDFLLSRYKEPIMHLTIRRVRALPWLEVGDRVRVQDPDYTGILANCLIGRIEWSFSSARYTQTIHAMAYRDIFPRYNYFILGTSRYGRSGEDVGRLFW